MVKLSWEVLVLFLGVVRVDGNAITISRWKAANVVVHIDAAITSTNLNVGFTGVRFRDWSDGVGVRWWLVDRTWVLVALAISLGTDQVLLKHERAAAIHLTVVSLAGFSITFITGHTDSHAFTGGRLDISLGLGFSVAIFTFGLIDRLDRFCNRSGFTILIAANTASSESTQLIIFTNLFKVTSLGLTTVFLFIVFITVLLRQLTFKRVRQATTSSTATFLSTVLSSLLSVTRCQGHGDTSCVCSSRQTKFEGTELKWFRRSTKISLVVITALAALGLAILFFTVIVKIADRRRSDGRWSRCGRCSNRR
mmetsp:Transcript_1219/g.1728  ORF Transcript_1219/g.1728 Transcript_1219/m.1728 type:complete len:309 (-) Transcript_1219:322-1248(-)